MKVIILCGGAGTRISGGDRTVKKEMVEIGGRPILWHIMKIFAAYGHSDFLLPLGYRGDLIRRYFLDYEVMNRDLSFTLGLPIEPTFHDVSQEGDWRITLVDTGLETNKGARIKRLERYMTTSPFFSRSRKASLRGDRLMPNCFCSLVSTSLSPPLRTSSRIASVRILAT